MRWLIVGVLGGLAMFIWATIAHVVTPLASLGLRQMPNEAATIAVLQTNLGTRPGLYFFPAAQGRAGDAKAMKAQEEKLKSGPSGLLAYEPPGAPGLTPRQLIIEFALEVVESLFTAVVLGAVAAMATNFSCWDWYGFDLDYTLANAFTELMKFAFGGAVIAAVFGRRSGRAS